MVMASETWDPGTVCHSCCRQVLMLKNGYEDVNVEDSPPPPALHQGFHRKQAEPPDMTSAHTSLPNLKTVPIFWQHFFYNPCLAPVQPLCSAARVRADSLSTTVSLRDFTELCGA